MADIALNALITKDKQVTKKARKAKTLTKRKEAQQERVHRAEQRTKAKFVKLRKINQEREEGKLRVLGLHPDVRSDELLSLFSTYGDLKTCRVDLDDYGRSLTTATVIFFDSENAKTAKNSLNQSKILNSLLTVEFPKQKYLTPRHKKIFKRGNKPQPPKEPKAKKVKKARVPKKRKTRK